MKTYRRSEGTAPFILNLNTRFRPLYPRGKRSGHSLKLSEPEPIRRIFWKTDKYRVTAGTGNPGRPARSLVTIATELHRLRF